jgi:hypothetical protein
MEKEDDRFTDKFFVQNIDKQHVSIIACKTNTRIIYIKLGHYNFLVNFFDFIVC